MMAAHWFSVSLFSSVCVCALKSTMCVYFYMFLMVMWSSCYTVTGQHQVMGSQPVLATVGDDVTLPCHIEPPKPPVNMERKTLEWLRPDLKPEFVHLLQDGRFKADEQNPLYKDRTSLFAEKLPHGNISLKLSRVQLSDEGTYKCFVPHLKSSTLKSSTLIQLFVGAVSNPVISSNGPKDGGVSLTCDSGCWYPEPEMSWLDGDGTLLSAEPSVTETRPPHCYIVQSNVTVRTAGHVTCRVHLPRFNRTADIQLTISEDMIPSERESTGGQTAGIVILVIIIFVSAAVLGYLYWKKKQAGRSRYQRPGTTSTKPRKSQSTSPRWKKQLDNLANIDDSEVINVGSFVMGNNKEFHIGTGNNGTEVFLGLTDDGTGVAVKRMTSTYAEALEKETVFSSLLKLDGPSIVQYVDFAKDENFGYLALQLCEYNLKEYIKEYTLILSELQRKQLVHQVLQSLRFLHRQSPPILHRDLKPENVLIDTVGNARLADFGIIQQPHKKTSDLTRWVAKEMLMGEEDGVYTIHCDTQVAGMLIYYILSGGHHPFGENLVCVNNIGKEEYDLDHVQDVEAKHLIEWMINGDPKKRPSVEECLAHPFFWSNERRVEYLRRIVNQQEVVNRPDDDLIRALDQYAEQRQFNTWKHKFPPELVQKMDGLKSYPENSGLLHFIHNLHEKYAEDAAHIDLMEMFPGLVGCVYQFAQEQDWNSRSALQEIIQREEVSTSSV